MSETSSSVRWLIVTKMQVHILRNFKGSLSLESLLQIAATVKIIENAQKQRQRTL